MQSARDNTHCLTKLDTVDLGVDAVKPPAGTIFSCGINKAKAVIHRVSASAPQDVLASLFSKLLLNLNVAA